VLPHLGSTDIPFSSYPVKDKFVEQMGIDNSSHVYCQVKGWSKNVAKFSQMFLERVFEMV
jgi:hypothetical protein